MSKKVLVLATSFLDSLISHPAKEGQAKKMLDELSENSNGEIEIIYRCERNPEEPLKVEELKNITAVIADLEKYDRELLSQVGIKAGGSLELIARYGIGYSSVDVKAATDYRVIVTNCPGCNALPTAEWTHSTILDVAGRRISHYRTASQGKPKEGLSRLDISGKILGIIGTGLIGKLVLKLMNGYEMKVIAYDLYPDKNWATQNNVEYMELNKLCQTADIITLHAAANETIIRKEQIDLMKDTTILVNCARGILVDYKAAYNSVKAGKIWGYGVDEIWQDKSLSLEGLNIIVSPHVGSDTDKGKIGMQIMSTQAVIDFLEGKIPKHVINKEVLQL
ncbi:MAG: NAD(P)-dependent oxidoreductase [bacterium]